MTELNNINKANKRSKERRKVLKSIRWNGYDDAVVVEALKTNQKNAWVVDRVNVSKDKVSFTKLSEQEQYQYILTFVILSKIDALQGNIGMDILAENCTDSYVSSVFRYEAGMEIVHSASYNKQIASLISTLEEERYIDIVDNSKEVADVVDFLIESMIDLDENFDISREVAFQLQLAYSTILESFLFYLFFYYPLYQANVKQRMNKCAEVIRLILRDGSVHGAFSGYIFQRESAKLSTEENKFVSDTIAEFMSEMYKRIENLLDFVYEEKHIREDIQHFANYNFNRTLKNLGYEEVFEGEDIEFHTKVLEEVQDDIGVTMVHDIFSMTGKVYFMMESQPYNEKNKANVSKKIEARHSLTPPLRIK